MLRGTRTIGRTYEKGQAGQSTPDARPPSAKRRAPSARRSAAAIRRPRAHPGERHSHRTPRLGTGPRSWSGISTPTRSFSGTGLP